MPKPPPSTLPNKEHRDPDMMEGRGLMDTVSVPDAAVAIVSI